MVLERPFQYNFQINFYSSLMFMDYLRHLFYAKTDFRIGLFNVKTFLLILFSAHAKILYSGKEISSLFICDLYTYRNNFKENLNFILKRHHLS